MKHKEKLANEFVIECPLGDAPARDAFSFIQGYDAAKRDILKALLKADLYEWDEATIKLVGDEEV